mmetsp:Transcript_5727/g.16114  ORF Transcript_5727/g.16114 Transcript_5727/m.16114 type:complete len:318 (-) Transcript_5727:1514-2467(-)
MAMHMLGGVFEVAMSTILILGGENRNALKPPPTKAKYQRVIALEDLLVPAMLLETAAEESLVSLLGREATEDHGHDGIERLEKLDGNSIDTDTNVQSLAEAFMPKPGSLALLSKFFLVSPEPSLLFSLQSLNVFAFGLLVILSCIACFLIFIVFIVKIFLLGRLSLGVELAKLIVGHTSRRAITIVIIFIVGLNDLPIGTKLFAGLKILKVPELVIVYTAHAASTSICTVGITPLARNELVSQGLEEAVFSVVKPNGHVKIIADIVCIGSLRLLKSGRILLSERVRYLPGQVTSRIAAATLFGPRVLLDLEEFFIVR